MSGGVGCWCKAIAVEGVATLIGFLEKSRTISGDGQARGPPEKALAKRAGDEEDVPGEGSVEEKREVTER